LVFCKDSAQIGKSSPIDKDEDHHKHIIKLSHITLENTSFHTNQQCSNF